MDWKQEFRKEILKEVKEQKTEITILLSILFYWQDNFNKITMLYNVIMLNRKIVLHRTITLDNILTI